jgi:4-diphosphocytidyl-2-C-methyl-D-erythritol kinase
VSAVAKPRARSARVAAQAKINLRLRMLARGTTGYHELETIFLKLALADDVLVRITTGERSLDVEGGLDGDVDPRALGPTERNLAWRAATAYAEHASWLAGFTIELRKNIPIGAGLGGGSADAAAVLRALDALAPKPLGEPTLLQIAQHLGADVPFLASSSVFALAWGRGQRMLALEPPEEREVLLVVPPFAVDTAAAYRWFGESRDWNIHDQHPAGVLRPDTLREWPTLASLAVNDFQAVVHGRHAMLDGVESCLRRIGCDPVMLTGSGSSVFGVLPRGHRVDAGSLARDPAMGGSRVLLTSTATSVAPVLDDV